MNKQQIVEFIAAQIESGKISKNDLREIADGHPAAVRTGASSKNLINVFYTIGAIIVGVGVIILVAQNWDDIGFVGRILVTLAISLVTYIAALLMKNPEQNVISNVLFALSAALTPLGAYVLVHEANMDFSWGVQSITALILLLVYGVALYIRRKSTLVLICLLLGTWAYYTFILKYLNLNYVFRNTDYLKWSTMLLGVAYLLIAYGYHSEGSKRVQHIIYGLGTLAVLGAGISIGGSFDLFYIIMIFAAFYGSVYLRSRVMLILGALFLVAHIIKLTSKYFIDSIGWPVALIGVGFLVIGIGYATFYLNKKFISAK